MQIYGLNKTTLLDYPEHLAATVFTGGCDFRCPFCHNGLLVTQPSSQPRIEESAFFDFLKKRKHIIQGVCITGGEPLLQKDIKEFILEIKKYDLLVKVDTNGYHPTVLSDLLSCGIIDYIAMDIKTSLPHYELVTGFSAIDKSKIVQSVELLKNTSIAYEFRTTVVKELHSKEDFELISEWLLGCNNYFLQAFEASEHVLTSGFHSYSKAELETFLSIVQLKIPHASLRGIQ